MDKPKVVFFVKTGLDSFLKDIIEKSSQIFEVKKVVVDHTDQVKHEMEWADICWFEWCDDLIAYGSMQQEALNKRVICRLHSYEAFTDMPSKVNWNVVDTVIFVGDFIRDYAVEKFNIPKEKTVVIPNGIDLDHLGYRERGKGWSIAYLGYINFKKGPMLLLHTFEAMHRKNPRYRLYIAGQFQEERDVLYFKQMIKEMGLEGAVVYEGWQEDIDTWLEDKNYILCTSQLESQNVSVMQAMAKGIKPVVHNFVGAKSIYPKEYLFNTIPEAVAMLDGDYESAEYRSFVERTYDSRIIWNKISQVISNKDKENNPLVSVVMTVYNKEAYVADAISSVLDQSYDNLELIIVNDGSTDESAKVIEGFKDKRIKYVERENRGQLDALKTGLQLAMGDYVARVDSDDMIDKEYIKTCLWEMMSKPELDFVYTDFMLIGDQRDQGRLSHLSQKEAEQTQGDQGRLMQEEHFSDFNNPQEIITQVFSHFSSVIPDAAFYKREYVGEVVVNYCSQNIPFYIDTITSCKYSHVKKCLYYYRQHGDNFASNEDNYVQVLEGKLKFEDFIIRKYFIQRNILKGFPQHKVEYYKLFGEYYESLGKTLGGAREDVQKLIKSEEDYWRGRIDNTIKEDYKYKNFRVAIVSADNPLSGRAVGGKHVHINLLQNALDILGTVNYLLAYEHDSSATVNVNELKKWLGCNISDKELLKDSNINFACLIYSIEKQLEDKLEKLLKDRYVSCVSAQDVIGATAAKKVIKKLELDIPVVMTVHGYFVNENVDYRGLSRGDFICDYFMEYERKAYECSDSIITVDSRTGEYVRAAVGDGKPIKVLANAVDNATFTPCDKSKEILKNIFLVPRRLVPKNGVLFSLMAAKKLVNRGENDFQLLIAGDGVERERILNYIKENKLEDNVTYLGAVPHNQMLQYFRTAKGVIIPSVKSNNVEEATSIAALEAMSCGRVAIVSNIGGLKEIVRDGENGIVVKPGDVDELANAMDRVISMDDETWMEMGRKAQQYAQQNHGYISHAKQFITILQSTSV